MSTHAVVFLILFNSHNVSKSYDFYPYYASPLIVDLRGGIHCQMTIPYNLFAFSVKTSSLSIYFLTRISHIFILIFDSSYVLVIYFDMCLFMRFGNGSFRSVTISTMSSALCKFFRTSWTLSKVTPWSSILVISPRTAFNSGVSCPEVFLLRPSCPTFVSTSRIYSLVSPIVVSALVVSGSWRR